MAGYPFRPDRSSRAVVNCRSCLDFGHVRLRFSSATEANDPVDVARNDMHSPYVSTSPVLDPLAAESLRP